MISGPAPDRPATAGPRLPLLALLALLLAFGADGAAQAAGAISFERVLRDLAAVRTVDVPFTETRHIAILSEPLTLHGTLIYRRPDFLEKRVTSPVRQRFTLDGNRVTLIDAQGRKRTLSLDMAPGLSDLVGAYRALLRGDRNALEFDYWTKFSAQRNHWRLELEPKARKLQDVLKSVTIDGDGARIDTIVTTQANGDRSVMHMQTPTAGGKGPAE